ncbi:MAG: copper amine oxidase [Clostridiales bacterium]|nr:copper amine oxidase [Clostridiales bacterium]
MKFSRKAIIGTSILTAALMFAGTSAVYAADKVPNVVLDGEKYEGDLKLIDGTTYVRLREFSESLGGDVSWENDERIAGVTASGLELSAQIGENYISANGRYLWSPLSVFIENDRTYVPLRAIGKAFGFNTEWSGEKFEASLKRERDAIKSADTYYSDEDLYWLSRIISAEAGGEPLEGKLAVGAVVLNRVRDSSFPDTVYGVIFDRNNGTQFTPTSNGAIFARPNAESIIAAKLCLEGYLSNEDIMFFINTELAESFWITKNRQFVMSIGAHDFYA